MKTLEQILEKSAIIFLLFFTLILVSGCRDEVINPLCDETNSLEIEGIEGLYGSGSTGSGRKLLIEKVQGAEYTVMKLQGPGDDPYGYKQARFYDDVRFCMLAGKMVVSFHSRITKENQFLIVKDIKKRRIELKHYFLDGEKLKSDGHDVTWRTGRGWFAKAWWELDNRHMDSNEIISNYLVEVGRNDFGHTRDLVLLKIHGYDL